MTNKLQANPEIFEAIQHNFSVWYASVLTSIVSESQCTHIGPDSTPKPPNALVDGVRQQGNVDWVLDVTDIQ